MKNIRLLMKLALSASALLFGLAHANLAVPGANTYVHESSKVGWTLNGHEKNWKLATPGKGWVKFKAKAKHDIFVAFANKPQRVEINTPNEGADYRFLVGGWSNSKTAIRRNLNGSFTDQNGQNVPAHIQAAETTQPQALVPNAEWQNYWFAVDNGVVTYGQGEEVGKNELLRFTDKQAFADVQYVLIGSADDRAEFTNIEMSSVRDLLPGGTTFTYIHDGRPMLKFHENWKLAQAGNGWVKFKARTPRDIFVAFSENGQEVDINAPAAGSDYRFLVGGWANTQSAIRRNANGALQEVAVNNKPDALVTGGLPADGSQWDEYWFKLENGAVSFGKGSIVGKNELLRYSEEKPLQNLRYVLIGAYPDGGNGVGKAEFQNIEIGGNASNMKVLPFKPALGGIQKAINVPEGFVREAGQASRITVGSKDGQLETWALQDGKLYRYNNSTMDLSPLLPQTFKDENNQAIEFKDIACASDGTFAALNKAGKALMYAWDKRTWSAINSETESPVLKFIAVGSKNCIWAVGEDNRVYQLTQAGWTDRSSGAYVAAGIDETVVGLSATGVAYRFIGGRWVKMAEKAGFDRVAVGDRDAIFGLTKDSDLWQWKGTQWQQVLGTDGKPATGFDEIALNAVGTFFAADEDGDFYRKGEAGVLLVPAEAAQVQAETRKVQTTLNALLAGQIAPAAVSPEVKELVAAVAPAALEVKSGQKPEVKIMPTQEQIKQAVQTKLTKVKEVKEKKKIARKVLPLKKKTTGNANKAKAPKNNKSVAKSKKAVSKPAAVVAQPAPVTNAPAVSQQAAASTTVAKTKKASTKKAPAKIVKKAASKTAEKPASKPAKVTKNKVTKKKVAAKKPVAASKDTAATASTTTPAA